MNNWINFVKEYAVENGLSYKEAMKEAKDHYQSGGSLKSRFVRNIIYKADKFNPNKMNKKSKYIQEGTYFNKHQEIFNENENTNKIIKLRSDLITEKLLKNSRRKLSNEQIKKIENLINQIHNKLLEVETVKESSGGNIDKHLFLRGIISSLEFSIHKLEKNTYNDNLTTQLFVNLINDISYSINLLKINYNDDMSVITNQYVKAEKDELVDEKMTNTELQNKFKELLIELSVKNNNNLNEVIAVISNFNNFLLSGRKSMFKSADKIEMFETMSNAIRGYDYYPTPAKYADMIFTDVKNWYENDMNLVSILDVACGLLSLSMPFLRNGNKVFLNEFNPQFTKILQPLEKNENVKLSKGDFFELSEDYYFKKDIDVIVMNPPFSGNIDDKNDKKIYLYFIIKAIDILYNSKVHKYDRRARFLYVICPKTHFGNGKVGDFVDFNIPKTYINKAHKMFNIDYLEDTTHHITFLSDVNGFKTLRNGKPSELKATFGLYKFEIM